MAIGTEIARLTRTVNELVSGVDADLRRKTMTPAERRSLKTEIDTCMLKLNELRSRLNG